jgi:hypothetical protein
LAASDGAGCSANETLIEIPDVGKLVRLKDETAEADKVWPRQFRVSVSTSQSFLDYDYISQTGDAGFFGRYNVDHSVSGDFAPLNGWIDSSKIISGPSSGQSRLSTLFKPIFSVTKALSMSAPYQIGRYHIGAAPSSSSFSTGNWTRPCRTACDRAEIVSLIDFDQLPAFTWGAFSRPAFHVFRGGASIGRRPIDTVEPRFRQNIALRNSLLWRTTDAETPWGLICFDRASFSNRPYLQSGSGVKLLWGCRRCPSIQSNP